MPKFTHRELAWDILYYINKDAAHPVEDVILDRMSDDLKRMGKATLDWMWAAVQHLD